MELLTIEVCILTLAAIAYIGDINVHPGFTTLVASKKRVEFRCDNHSLVDAVTKGSSRENMVMHLLKCLWFLTAVFDIYITASHIPGVLNTAEDLLSKNQPKKMLLMHPLA